MTRRCPGTGKPCGQYLSKVETDPHSLCTKCRGQKCCPGTMCSECVSWDAAQWKKFVGRRSYVVQKGTPQSDRSSVVISPQISPPVLVMEVPLLEPFVASSPGLFPLSESVVTPRPGLIAPGFLPVPPTPVSRLQEQTRERFSLLVRELSNEEFRLQD